MNKYGFFIKKLWLEGKEVDDAVVTFDKGLNVIYGSSDAGKTFIYQCISYMLGVIKKVKSIPEAKKYTLVKLEIETYKGDIYVLERALKGGNFNLLDIKTEENRVLLVNNDKRKDDETISDFLLSLSNLSNKEIRKNADGVKQNLYFQDLAKYFLIDEEKILTEKSPISIKPERNFNPATTFEKNVFKFLMSGEDDANIITPLKAKEIQNKTGKIELYDELILQLNEDLKDIDYKEIDSQIEKLNKAIEKFKEESSHLNQELKTLNIEKNNFQFQKDKDEGELIKLNEILYRSRILEEQYLSDIKRLKASLEFANFLPKEKSSPCPVCDNEIKTIVNIEKITLGTQMELKKIELLMNEVTISKKTFNEEIFVIKNKIRENKLILQKIISKIETEVDRKLKAITEQVSIFINKKEKLSRIKTLKDKLDNYSIERDNIKNFINKNKKKRKDIIYEELTTESLIPILIEIQKILLEMNFKNMKTINIGFSEEALDFIIDDKVRGAFGKGYRAILYAVFIVSLLQYFRTTNYQIGLAIIDSPLNPYKPKDNDFSGKVDTDLAENFYRYLFEHIKNEQVIIIENTDVPDDILKKINFLEFHEGDGFLKG